MKFVRLGANLSLVVLASENVQFPPPLSSQLPLYVKWTGSVCKFCTLVGQGNAEPVDGELVWAVCWKSDQCAAVAIY